MFFEPYSLVTLLISKDTNYGNSMNNNEARKLKVLNSILTRLLISSIGITEQRKTMMSSTYAMIAGFEYIESVL